MKSSFVITSSKANGVKNSVHWNQYPATTEARQISAVVVRVLGQLSVCGHGAFRRNSCYLFVRRSRALFCYFNRRLHSLSFIVHYLRYSRAGAPSAFAGRLFFCGRPCRCFGFSRSTCDFGDQFAFLTMIFSMPNARAISRNSARLFPSSASKSCMQQCSINYFKYDFQNRTAVRSVGIRCKDNALFRITKFCLF